MLPYMHTIPYAQETRAESEGSHINSVFGQRVACQEEGGENEAAQSCHSYPGVSLSYSSVHVDMHICL